MIVDEQQLALVETQVARLERALDSLAKTVRPKSEKQYQIFAEGYVDQIAALRAEIDEYAKAKQRQPKAAANQK